MSNSNSCQPKSKPQGGVNRNPNATPYSSCSTTPSGNNRGTGSTTNTVRPKAQENSKKVHHDPRNNGAGSTCSSRHVQGHVYVYRRDDPPPSYEQATMRSRQQIPSAGPSNHHVHFSQPRQGHVDNTSQSTPHRATGSLQANQAKIRSRRTGYGTQLSAADFLPFSDEEEAAISGPERKGCNIM